jgi:hypothetical protein
LSKNVSIYKICIGDFDKNMNAKTNGTHADTILTLKQPRLQTAQGGNFPGGKFDFFTDHRSHQAAMAGYCRVKSF